ncbi:MAG: Gfo/Idh/MocA family oxidoreductase [Sulfitobacter sp.]
MKRILVVGGGLIGIRHVQAVAAHPRCALVGLVDPDRRVQADTQRFATMGDVQDTVDGVIIATPTHLHHVHAGAAAARGWHMLIEKPVAGTFADAQALKAALQKTNLRSLVGHHRRYHSYVQQLRSLIAQGTIGPVINTSLLWNMRKPDAYFDGNWRTAGGSPVMINLVHDIDILRFCIGEIVQTTALRGASVRGGDRIESGAIALLFENGATGTITFADTAPSPWGFEAGTGENPNIGTTAQDMMWVSGTKGALSFPSMTLWQGRDWGTAASKAPLEKAENTKPPLAAQLDHFINVMDGAPPLIDVADASRTLAIAEQIETQLAAQTPISRTACA